MLRYLGVRIGPTTLGTPRPCGVPRRDGPRATAGAEPPGNVPGSAMRK